MGHIVYIVYIILWIVCLNTIVVAFTGSSADDEPLSDRHPGYCGSKGN